MKFKLFPVIFIFLLIIVLGAGYFYFFEIDSNNVEKPHVERPDEFQEFTADHLIFFLTELDMYKLHSHSITGEPAVFSVVADDQRYLFTVEDNELNTIESSENLDIRIVSSEEIILEIAEKKNPDDLLIESIKSGDINIEIIEDEATLAFKGYKSLYDKFSRSLDNITADAVKLSAFNIRSGFHLVTLLTVSIVLWMIIKIEN